MADADKTDARVRVFARLRPAKQGEEVGHFLQVDKRAVVVQSDCHSLREEGLLEAKRFTYDGVFPASTTQQEVFDEIGAPVLQECLRGYNGTILAYGQTGSGKTYSLLDESGLLPRLVQSLFETISNDARSVYEVDVSAVQIYHDQVDDLMAEAEIQTDPREPIQKLRCKSSHDLLTAFSKARQNLIYAETRMNKASSRSHSIFHLRVLCHRCGERPTMSSLRIVDLAGSERVKKSQVEGRRFRETTSINKSLLALGNVVNALAFKKPHVPFRDSKLTTLLSDAFGGNCKTALLVCISPSISSASETISSLEFATRAMDVEVHASVNRLPGSSSVDEQTSQMSLFADQAKVWQQQALDAEGRAKVAQQSAEKAHETAAEAKSRISQLEVELAHWKDRSLVAEAARSSCAEHLTTLESQFARERRLAFDSLERERRHSGKLQESMKTLEMQLTQKGEALQDAETQVQDLQKYIQQLEMQVTAQEMEKKEVEEEIRCKRQAMEAEEIKQQITLQTVSAKEAALDELLEATRRKEAELLEREAALEEGFASEKQRLLEDCRQQIHDQQSELLTQVKARENRVSAQMSKCQRKSEVELERRLALISAQERSAQEALQHRQQIQQQAEEIQHLQQRLERAESEPKLKDLSDTKWRRQVRRVRSCVGERTMRTVSRSASLTLLGQLTPSTCSSTPAGAARTKQKAEDPLR